MTTVAVYPKPDLDGLSAATCKELVPVFESACQVLFTHPWVLVTHAVEFANTPNAAAKAKAAMLIKAWLGNLSFADWFFQHNPKERFPTYSLGHHQRSWLVTLIDKLKAHRSQIKVSFVEPTEKDYAKVDKRVRICRVIWCNGVKVGIVYTHSNSLMYQVSIDLVQRREPNPEFERRFARHTLQGAYNSASRLIRGEIAAMRKILEGA